MSEKTESPALLSPERLKQIATWAEALQGPRSGPAHVRDGEMIDELLADRAAFRQMVATELYDLIQFKSFNDDVDDYANGHNDATEASNDRVKALATRLGIDLSPAHNPS